MHLGVVYLFEQMSCFSHYMSVSVFYTFYSQHVII